MKVDFTPMQIGAGALMAVSVGLFLIRRPLVQFFSAFLFGLLALDLLLPWFGVGRTLWSALHFPSTLLAGGHGFAGPHGDWVEAGFRLADLALWAILLSLPFAARERWLRKHPDEKEARHWDRLRG